MVEKNSSSASFFTKGLVFEEQVEALTEGKAAAALAASIFHYDQYSVKEVKDYLRGRNVPVK